jgi:hypothetical protein
MADKHLRGKPSYPAEKLFKPSAPDELEVVLEEQLSDHVSISSGGGILDASSTSPCAVHHVAARRRSSRAASLPSSSRRTSPNRW